MSRPRKATHAIHAVMVLAVERSDWGTMRDGFLRFLQIRVYGRSIQTHVHRLGSLGTSSTHRYPLQTTQSQKHAGGALKSQ